MDLVLVGLVLTALGVSLAVVVHPLAWVLTVVGAVVLVANVEQRDRTPVALGLVVVVAGALLAVNVTTWLWAVTAVGALVVLVTLLAEPTPRGH